MRTQLGLSFICIVLNLFIIYSTADQTLAKNSTVTYSNAEIRALEKLRPMVSKLVYRDYMREDEYLIRFLRARNLNVQGARDMIQKAMAWRKQNKIDGILEEKLDIQRAMPYHLTYDLKGRPAGFVRVGEWKVRRYLLAHKHDEIVRAVYKLAELAEFKIREAASKVGKNITQGIGVADMAGFNAREHTCVLCIPLYLDMVGQYEKYFPQLAYKLIATNTPRLVISLYDTLKYVASQYTQDTVVLYGYDKSEWRRALLEFLADDQIPVYLGGKFKGPEITE